jgi:hypothetical protein
MPNHVHGIIVIRPGVGAIHELTTLQAKPTAGMRVADRRGNWSIQNGFGQTDQRATANHRQASLAMQLL